MSEIGKIPPQAIDIEEALLGAIMLDANILDEIIQIANNSNMFYKDSNRTIYESILRLFNQGKAIDILTVTQDVRNAGKLDQVGGVFYITTLTNRIASTAHAEEHAYIIKEKYIKREFIRIANDIIRKSFDEMEDLKDVVNFTERELYNLMENSTKNEAERLNEIVPEVIKDIEEASKENKAIGLPSGITQLDRLIYGFKKGVLCILAARPGMGKTAFALQLARNTSSFNHPVLIFSLEMTCKELTMRIISGESKVNSDSMNSGMNKNEWQKLENSLSKIENLPIFIDDSAGISIYEFRSKARKYKRKYGIEMIIIDYIQLMKGDQSYKNSVKEVGSISNMCKNVAKELDLPVIALSQLNRKVEDRGSKIPQLSDLRDSGEIEQDADIVIFPFRPYEAGIKQDEAGNTTYNRADIIIAKNRAGKQGSIELYVSNDKTNWSESEIIEEINPF